jgi:hypothetical protein
VGEGGKRERERRGHAYRGRVDAELNHFVFWVLVCHGDRIQHAASSRIFDGEDGGGQSVSLVVEKRLDGAELGERRRGVGGVRVKDINRRVEVVEDAKATHTCKKGGAKGKSIKEEEWRAHNRKKEGNGREICLD